MFARGTDGAIWHRAFAGSWAGWESIGGIGTSAPGATSWGPGRIDVFVRGNDRGLWHKFWDAGTWSGWEGLGGPLTSAPSASSWGVGRIDLVALMDGTPSHLHWANQWSPWFSLGGRAIGDPAIVDLAVGTSNVFVRGSDNALWYASPPF